jgi:hypothetical protein
MAPVEVDGVQRAFIVSNPHLERLLFDRNLIGLGFEATCMACSVEFVGHFEDELDIDGWDIAELVILSKGLHYGLGRAFASALHRNLETNFVATRRVTVQGSEATVQVLYEDFDAGHGNIVIGDTIASGATICATLSAYLEHRPLSRVFVFTFAGSGVGGRRIGAFCRERGIQLTIAYGLAVFGLGANGFDLSFLHPETITSDSYVKRAAEQFQGRPVSAVGWDFGSQAQAIEKYRNLCWIEAECWGLQDGDVFSVAERPHDMRLVQREHGAWDSRLTPSLERRDPCGDHRAQIGPHCASCAQISSPSPIKNRGLQAPRAAGDPGSRTV